MERKDLKTRLAEQKKAIKAQFMDKGVASQMINELLSLQKQIDIEPTEEHIPVSDVIATYDFGAFQLVKCKTCIIFKTTCYRLIAKPTLADDGGALYAQMLFLCDMKDEYATIDEEKQKLYELVFNVTITILSLPIDAFADETFLFTIAKTIVEEKNKLYKKLLNKELEEETEEDLRKNLEFENSIKLAEEMKVVAGEDNNNK